MAPTRLTRQNRPIWWMLAGSSKKLTQRGSRCAVRIQIPRVVVALYEVRNNRGVGRVGGDVNPNAMDASFVLASAKWLMAELVRIFHGVDTMTAEETVDRIVETVTCLSYGRWEKPQNGYWHPASPCGKRCLSCFTTLLGGSTRRHCWRG